MNLQKDIYRLLLVIICIMTINWPRLQAQEEGRSQKKMGYFEQSNQIGYVLLEADTAEDGAVKISMKSHYTINPTIELKVDESSSCVIENDSILVISSDAMINDRSRYKITQQWHKDKNIYTREVNARVKDLSLPILNSIHLNLFFNAPVEGMNQIYSEVFDKQFSVEKNSSKKYTITDHLDRKQVFEYDEEGNFVRAEIENATGVYEIKEIKK